MCERQLIALSACTLNVKGITDNGNFVGGGHYCSDVNNVKENKYMFIFL